MKRKMLRRMIALFMTAGLLAGCAAQPETPAAQTTQEVVDTTAAATSETTAAVPYTCSDAAVKMLAQVDFPSMVEIKHGEVSQYLSVDIPETTDFAMYLCGSGGFSDEIFITSTEGVDVDALSKAVEARIGQRYTDFEDYVPEEAEKLNNSVVAEIPGYFMYFVTTDNDKCVAIAEEMLT